MTETVFFVLLLRSNSTAVRNPMAPEPTTRTRDVGDILCRRSIEDASIRSAIWVYVCQLGVYSEHLYVVCGE